MKNLTLEEKRFIYEELLTEKYRSLITQEGLCAAISYVKSFGHFQELKESLPELFKQVKLPWFSYWYPRTEEHYETRMKHVRIALQTLNNKQ